MLLYFRIFKFVLYEFAAKRKRNFIFRKINGRLSKKNRKVKWVAFIKITNYRQQQRSQTFFLFRNVYMYMFIYLIFNRTCPFVIALNCKRFNFMRFGIHCKCIFRDCEHFYQLSEMIISIRNDDILLTKLISIFRDWLSLGFDCFSIRLLHRIASNIPLVRDRGLSSKRMEHKQWNWKKNGISTSIDIVWLHYYEYNTFEPTQLRSREEMPNVFQCLLCAWFECAMVVYRRDKSVLRHRC